MTQAAARLLVLQHIECEPPALYEDVLVECEVGFDRIQLGNGDPLPDWKAYAGLIVMGGPMSANDDASYPWLISEKALIAEAVRARIPYWGVCLGAQLLAAALGAEVYTGKQPEVGMAEVELTAAAATDPIFQDLDECLRVFQWHSETFTLPDGARRLATSAIYDNQAFSWGSAYGLQFHVEVTEALAVEWGQIPEYISALESVHGKASAPRVISELRDNISGNSTVARLLFSAWLRTYILG